jgi:hypothetical protein
MTISMKTYRTTDGAAFHAADATALMTQLRESSFNPEKDLRSYCRATARACRMQTGRLHRAWPPEDLVTDMTASGLITTE